MAIKREDYLKKFKKLTNIKESVIKQIKDIDVGAEDDVPFSSGVVEPGVEPQPTGPNLTSEVDKPEAGKEDAPALPETPPAPTDQADTTPPAETDIPAPEAVPSGTSAADASLPPDQGLEGDGSELGVDDGSIDTPEVNIGGPEVTNTQDDVQNELLRIQVSALEKLSNKFDEIESQILSLNDQMAKYAAEVEKVKEPNPVEKLENRWEDSYPFKYRLNDLWDGNTFQGNKDLFPKSNGGVKQTEDGSYIATLADISDFNGVDIKNSFTEGVEKLQKKINDKSQTKKGIV